MLYLDREVEATPQRVAPREAADYCRFPPIDGPPNAHWAEGENTQSYIKVNTMFITENARTIQLQNGRNGTNWNKLGTAKVLQGAVGTSSRNAMGGEHPSRMSSSKNAVVSKALPGEAHEGKRGISDLDRRSFFF